MLSAPWARIAAWAFFLGYLALGIAIFDDYGICWDDDAQRWNGLMNYRYVFQGNDVLLSNPERNHGPAFEVALILMEKAAGLSDTREIYLARHLLTFLVYFGGSVAFYYLGMRIMRDRRIALLGCVFLLISPRLFADSFYNSKDAPFCALFTVSTLTLLRYVQRRTPWRGAVHAVCCGVLIDIRIVGVQAVALTLGLIVLGEALKRRQRAEGLVVRLYSYLLFMVISAGTVVLFWPVLWSSPIDNFAAAFREMSRFHYKGAVLFLGECSPACDLPHSYIPVWIAISTPLSILGLTFVGLVSRVVHLVRSVMTQSPSEETLNDVVLLSWVLVPVASVMVFDSVMYDGWRHLFFIYPGMLLLALTGLLRLRALFAVGRGRRPAKVLAAMLFAGLAFDLLSTAVFMVRNHPYQNVYFNRLAGSRMSEVKMRFELDYWGLSYREAIETILQRDQGDSVAIFAANFPGEATRDIIRKPDRDRLRYVNSVEEATYFVSNYRWHPREYPYEEEFYSIMVGDAKIMVAYRLEPLAEPRVSRSTAAGQSDRTHSVSSTRGGVRNAR